MAEGSLIVVRAGIVTTTVVLGLAYVLVPDETWFVVFAVGGVGIVWFTGAGKNWRWLPDTALVTLTGLAAWGLYLEKSAILMLLGGVAALVTWDLDLFSQRLAQAGWLENEATLKRAHWQRLLVMAGLSLLLGGLALGVAIPISFGGAVFLGLLVVVSLSWVVGSLKQR